MPFAYGRLGQYLKGMKMNFILSNNWVPDKDTIPKYRNIPKRTGTGMALSMNFPFKHKPMAMCTRMLVTRCSFTSISFGFSPGIIEVE